MRTSAVQSTQTYSPAKKVAKAVVKTTVASAAIAAGLAIGAKKGKFAVNENTNKYLAKVFPYLDKAGSFINKQVGKVATKFAEFGIKEKITNSRPVRATIKFASEAKKKISSWDIPGKIKGAFEKVKSFFQTNIGKYNPDKAGAADLAAETFSNFVK